MENLKKRCNCSKSPIVLTSGISLISLMIAQTLKCIQVQLPQVSSSSENFLSLVQEVGMNQDALASLCCTTRVQEIR